MLKRKSKLIELHYGLPYRDLLKKGRKSYDGMRKPVRAKELRKGITIRTRYAILKRDNFRCVLCGSDASDTRLEIDHIIPVTNGGSNDLKNLRTLCVACNRGKRYNDKER